jgi:Protein of unknown function (DUF2934)
MGNDREERIRQRAHEIWEREGRPHGADRRHWDQASEEIRAEDASRDVSSAATTGTSPPLEKIADVAPARARHASAPKKPKRGPPSA